jgi:hypothetical protein
VAVRMEWTTSRTCWSPTVCRHQLLDRCSVGVLLGNGDGTSGGGNVRSGGFHTVSVTVGDVNRDGKPIS